MFGPQLLVENYTWVSKSPIKGDKLFLKSFDNVIKFIHAVAVRVGCEYATLGDVMFKLQRMMNNIGARSRRQMLRKTACRRRRTRAEIAAAKAAEAAAPKKKRSPKKKRPSPKKQPAATVVTKPLIEIIEDVVITPAATQVPMTPSTSAAFDQCILYDSPSGLISNYTLVDLDGNDILGDGPQSSPAQACSLNSSINSDDYHDDNQIDGSWDSGAINDDQEDSGGVDNGVLMMVRGSIGRSAL